MLLKVIIKFTFCIVDRSVVLPTFEQIKKIVYNMLPHQHSIISPYESHPVIVNMRQITISDS